MTCLMCDGPQKFLGTLGDRVHLRCINCGLDSSRTADGYDKFD